MSEDPRVIEGRNSEERIQFAIEALKESEIVRNVIASTPFSRLDRKGIDFTVKVWKGKANEVYVQSKSSAAAVREFIGRFGGKEGILDRKLIVLNGNELHSTEEIQTRFLKGLLEVDDHVKKYGQEQFVLPVEIREKVVKKLSELTLKED
jgi:hypothetical protein